MKKMALLTSLFLFLVIIFAACSGSGDKTNDSTSTAPDTTKASTDSGSTASNGNPSYDPNRGEGKFHDVKLGDKLDPH